MPSKRKRIGFLPSREIQDVINQICKHNKLSQSKVTGILVEEALIFRGVLDSSLTSKSNELELNSNKLLLNTNNKCKNEKHEVNHNLTLDEGYKNKEIQMINEFIEFKFFKNIMNQKKSI